MFSTRVEQLLRSLLDASQIKYQVVESRTKSIDSFQEKLSRPGKSYTEPLKELPDLCGCRIITYYSDDVERVSSIIKSEFDVIEEEMSHHPDLLEEDRFGYISVHYIVKINAKRRRLAEWKAFRDCHGEIQIRTVIQHAWSAVSHLLQYKQEASIPSKLRRRLFRIAGLFELADEEFVGIREQRSELERQTAEQLEEGNKSIPLTSTSIQQFISRWTFLDRARAAAQEAGYNLAAHDADYSMENLVIPEIYELAKQSGIETIEQLEDAVSDPDFSPFAKMIVEDGGVHTVTNDYLLFVPLLAKYPQNYSVDQLVAHHWTQPWAEKLINIVRSK